jgi:hypothetical protein
MDLLKTELSNDNAAEIKPKHTINQMSVSTQCLDFKRNTNWLAFCFSLIKKPKLKFSLNLCLGNLTVQEIKV